MSNHFKKYLLLTECFVRTGVATTCKTIEYNLRYYEIPQLSLCYYQCSICQKKFSCQDYLKKHFLTHESESEHKCDICNKTFKRSDNLKRHMKIHTDSAQVYNCPFLSLTGCKRVFKRYDKLKDHVKTHGK